MIRKLRIKFVLINMTIVTLLLGTILGLTYGFTRTKMENQSVRMMQAIAAAPFRANARLQSDGELRLPYFAIRLGPDGEQLAVGGGYYNLTDEEIRELVERCQSQDSRIGEIPQYHLRYCRVEAPHSRYLVFADISSEIRTLRSLRHTCLLIGAVGFAGFLGASILLSAWAVRPVDRAFRRQRQFIADASHELKTPLTVILTNAQMLEQYGRDPEIGRRSLQNILTMTDQMKRLIEQMLTLARSEGSGRRSVQTETDLSRLAEQTVLPFESVFFEQGMKLHTDLTPGILVQGDPEALRQAITVLLDNASKYASPGGATWVTLRRLPGHRCRLTVADEGEAIEPEQLEQWFERFASGDPARNRPDSFGLGLAIARSIASNHRGRLWAESREGINSFHLELPTR